MIEFKKENLIKYLKELGINHTDNSRALWLYYSGNKYAGEYYTVQFSENGKVNQNVIVGNKGRINLSILFKIIGFKEFVESKNVNVEGRPYMEVCE